MRSTQRTMLISLLALGVLVAVIGLAVNARDTWRVKGAIEDLRLKSRNLDGFGRKIIADGGVTPGNRASNHQAAAALRRALDRLRSTDPKWPRLAAVAAQVEACLDADAERLRLLERRDFEQASVFDRLTFDPALDDLRGTLAEAARDEDARGWSLARVAIGGTAIAFLLITVLGLALLRLEMAARATRQALDERRRSDDRFRTMADTAPAILSVADTNMAATFLNRSWTEFTGRTMEEDLGEGWGRTLHPDDAERATAIIAAAGKRTEPFQMECRFRRHDGAYRWLLNAGQPSFDPSGRFTGYVGSCMDLTERHEAEEAVRESERRYRLLFDLLPLPTYLYDPDTLAFIDVNEAAIRHYGYSRDEFLTMTLKDIRPAEDVPRLIEAVGSVAEGGYSGAWRHRKKDGSLIDVEVSAHRITLGERQVGVVLVQDVSARKRLEAEYRQAQKMEAVGQLAGGVAHDFNNLLTAVLGYAQMMLKRHGHDPELRHPIEQIEQAGQRAATLTRRLLAFSRKQILLPETVDLNQVTSGLTGMLRRLIGEDIELVTILAPSLDRVHVDPGQVEQVLMNLVVNARDAMPAGGRLTIATANIVVEEGPHGRPNPLPAGRYVEVSVADTGCGMDELTRAHVFEPFFTTKEAGKGTGLGLATVYGIVRQSGGDVLITTAPGAGSTFRVLLPRLDQPATAPQAATEPEAEPEEMVGGSEAILLVEDEDMVRTLARRVLEELGYCVHEAPNGAEALAFVEKHAGRIDLLLSDIVMPRMSGCELAAALAPRRPEMKLLYMSGYADRNLASDGQLRPSGPVLHKPFSPAALATKVREVLEAA